MNREAIMSALFALVSGSSAYATASRRMKLWGDVPSSSKPAIFMAERGDDYARGSDGRPAIITINIDLYIYIDSGKDASVVPSTTLNNLLDALDCALAPTYAQGGRQTLGGLVSHCWIEGKILKEPGDLDGDGIAVVPVKILATV